MSQLSCDLFFLICCIHHFLDFYFYVTNLLVSFCTQMMTSLKSGGIDLNEQTPEQVAGTSELAFECGTFWAAFKEATAGISSPSNQIPQQHGQTVCDFCALSSPLAPFRQIIRSQEILAESRSRPAEAQAEVKNLQAELHSTLRTLQEEQQQQQDSENLLDDDKVPKATCQCSSFVEFSLSVRGISTTLTKCIRRRGHR